MGVKGIGKLIRELAKPGVQIKKLTEYSGKKIAIDGNQMLYKFICGIRNSGTDIMNNDGIVTTHLHGLFHKLCGLLSYGIKPIVFFDGNPPPIKSKEIADRKYNKKIAQTYVNEFNAQNLLLQTVSSGNDALPIEHEHNEEEHITNKNNTEFIKNFKRCVYIKPKYIKECKEMLNLMGIPYVQSVGESDPECVAFTNNMKHNVYGVLSDDMDMLAFGARKLLTNISIQDGTVIEYDLNIILRLLNISHIQFIELCILLGTSYQSNIKGIYGKKAYNALKSNGSISNIIKLLIECPDNINNKEFLENYLEKSNEIREYYLYPIIRDPELIDINWRQIKTSLELTALFDFLKDKGFDLKLIHRKILLLLDDSFNMKQML